MCAGLAVMTGPPTVAGCCWYVWQSGKERMLRAAAAAQTDSFKPAAASAATLVGSFAVQLKLLMPAFDEGGSLSLNWKKGVESLGQPLKIETWGQFYRAAGPPIFARTAALIVSFYIAGNAYGWAAAGPALPESRTKRGGAVMAKPQHQQNPNQQKQTPDVAPAQAVANGGEDYFVKRDRLKAEARDGSKGRGERRARPRPA